jgi:cell division protein FtsB
MTYSPDERIYYATSRLLSALERIELNLHNLTVGHDRDMQQNQHLQQYQRENSELRAEQEKLNATIATLEAQYQELQGVASKIYGKLDNSIDHLSRILEKS